MSSQTQPPMLQTDNTVTIIHGGSAFTIDNTHANWGVVKAAIAAKDWDELVEMLQISTAVNKYSQGKYLITEDGVATYEGEPIPNCIATRLVAMMREGEPFEFLLRFHERLQANPSHRAVQELYLFLEHGNMPIDVDGCFYAYKGVTNDFLDCHTQKFDNHVGTINSMPRNKVDDNRDVACSYGFHVGSLNYATHFGSQTVIVKVDPADVVSVPADHNNEKLRTCKYEVVALYTGPLPQTVYRPTLDYDEFEDDFDMDDDDDDLDVSCLYCQY